MCCDDEGVTLPSIFDDLDIGITIHDPETGAILGVNQRLEQLYGYSEPTLRQMDVEDYTPPTTKFTQEEAVRRIRAAADGRPQEFEWQIERANGELRWVDVSLNAATVDGRDCVVAEIQNITRQRAREQRLQLLSRIVRHNLRNRMTVVNGCLTQLESAIDGNSADDVIQKLQQEVSDVGDLSDSVRQIEEFATPDVSQRSPTDTGVIARRAVDRVRSSYPDAAITVDEQVCVQVFAGQGIATAVEQGVENAVQHNDNEIPTVTVVVTEDTASDHAIIRIRDDGPPIPDVETDVLDDTVETSNTYHGTGVGLWVIKWCVNSLGGELSFGENSPRGNVVSIALPTSPDDAGAASRGEVA